MNMITVSREELDTVAGLPWEQATEGRSILDVTHGYMTQQRDHPDWVPPTNGKGETLLFLPLNHAWLRKIDNRAFLYLQNW